MISVAKLPRQVFEPEGDWQIASQLYRRTDSAPVSDQFTDSHVHAAAVRQTVPRCSSGTELLAGPSAAGSERADCRAGRKPRADLLAPARFAVPSYPRQIALLLGMSLVTTWAIALPMPIPIEEVGIRVFICLFPLLLWILLRRCYPRCAMFFKFVTILAAAGYIASALIFAVATTAHPFADVALARCDSLLCLSGATLIERVNAHPLIASTLTFLYASALLQTIFGIGYLAQSRQERRLNVYAVRFILCAMLTAAGFYVFPAQGTCVAYRLPIPEYYAATLAQLDHLRTAASFSLDGPAGIVTFPSFHCIAAVLTASMFHRSRLFVPMAVLNALVVVSAVTVGFHYFADILGGLIVAFGVIAAVPVGGEIDR
jgi:membrane-associated phospholipid phosphatase